MWTLGEIFTRNARLYPDKGLIFAGNKLTYRDLNRRVNRLVRAMAGKGISKGDRVAILSKNCPEYIEVYGLAEKGGIILVPLNWRLVGRELKFMLADSGARALFVAPEHAPVIDGIRNELPNVGIYVSLHRPVPGYEFYEDVLQEGGADEPNVGIEPDDVAYIMYSSGTTGLPKGIMLTHGGQLDCAVHQLTELRSGERSVYLALLPLFHSGGNSSFLSHFFRGCNIVLLPEFDPREVLATIEKEKVTVVQMVPSMVAFLLDYPGFARYDTGSLETIFYVGSPMPLDLLQRGIAVFGPVFCQGYGLTEAGPLVTVLGREDHVAEGKPARLTSCGKPALATDVRVLHESGGEVGPGEVGEIVIRSRRLMKGYWNQPAKTAASLRRGWLYTGDMATVDEDGYIYVVDRKVDMIISGGENIYPREIEEVLYAHPAVLEAAVIGVPDAKWGESVKAYISLKQGASATEAEIIEFCRQNLASYKKPRSVEFLSELPRNASGKVVKRVLRDKNWAGHGRRV